MPLGRFRGGGDLEDCLGCRGGAVGGGEGLLEAARAVACGGVGEQVGCGGVIAGVPAAFCAISRAAPWFCANVTLASCSDWSGMPTKGRPAASAVCTLPWPPAMTARSTSPITRRLGSTPATMTWSLARSARSCVVAATRILAPSGSSARTTCRTRSGAVEVMAT